MVRPVIALQNKRDKSGRRVTSLSPSHTVCLHHTLTKKNTTRLNCAWSRLADVAVSKVALKNCSTLRGTVWVTDSTVSGVGGLVIDGHVNITPSVCRAPLEWAEQSVDNPKDTTNCTDLHKRPLVSQISLIPSSFMCPIPCLLSGDMRQETKH